MRRFNKNSKNKFIQYANQFGCSIATAIAERDEPASKATCIFWFLEATGRRPTQYEIEVMRPDLEEDETEFLKGREK